MHWFHEVGDMRWLVMFWVASFLVLLSMFWWMTRRPDKPRAARRTNRSPGPYEPTAPRPSI